MIFKTLKNKKNLENFNLGCMWSTKIGYELETPNFYYIHLMSFQSFLLYSLSVPPTFEKKTVSFFDFENSRFVT